MVHPFRRLLVLAAAPVAVLLFGGGAAFANVTLTQVSTDPYTDAQAQHHTEVEPDTFAFGSTIVSAFQVGRRSWWPAGAGAPRRRGGPARRRCGPPAPARSARP